MKAVSSALCAGVVVVASPDGTRSFSSGAACRWATMGRKPAIHVSEAVSWRAGRASAPVISHCSNNTVVRGGWVGVCPSWA